MADGCIGPLSYQMPKEGSFKRRENGSDYGVGKAMPSGKAETNPTALTSEPPITAELFMSHSCTFQLVNLALKLIFNTYNAYANMQLR